MDIVLFGIQGSGKGTQAKKLADEFGYSIFETGAELRAMAASGTELGNIVKSYIDAGNLAPVDIVMQAVKSAILSRPADQKILFDGIPRDADQMNMFNDIIRESGRSVRCIQLTLDDENAFARLQNRALEQGRADDANPEFIRRRMGIFKERTMPVIESYRAQGNMIDVDGGRLIDEVYEDVKKAIAN